MNRYSGALGVALELLAQVADVDVDRARVAVGGVAPDLLEQHLARLDPARRAGERGEDLELDVGELGAPRRARSTARRSKSICRSPAAIGSSPPAGRASISARRSAALTRLRNSRTENGLVM